MNWLSKHLNQALVVVIIVQVVGFVVLMGCTASSATPSNSITGIVVNVQMCQEDSEYAAMLVEFEDGRIQKLRCRYSNPVMFHTRKRNVIYYDKYGTIVGVDHD